MRPVSPRHRFNAVLAAAQARTPPSGEWEQTVYAVMIQGVPTNPTVVYAYDLYIDTLHRAILEAFIIANAPRTTIMQVLGIPFEVLEIYEYLFFDVTVFRNRLEKISYAANFTGDPFAAELLRTGVMIGPDYLVWTYGGREPVDTRTIVRYTMTDAFFRGMAHKVNGLTSGVTKEAQKWWATAIKNAEILEKMDPQATKQAYEELRIALEGVDETTSVEQSPVPLTEICH